MRSLVEHFLVLHDGAPGEAKRCTRRSRAVLLVAESNMVVVAFAVFALAVFSRLDRNLD